MTMLNSVITLTALCVVIWTLLPLSSVDFWWVRGFDFPRVQIAVIGIATLAAYLVFVGWRDPLDLVLLGVLTACIVLQLVRILPYTFLYPRQVHKAARTDRDNTIALMISNVLMSNRNTDALLQLVRARQPDVLLTVETDSWWEGKLAPLEADFPHTIKHPLDNRYGMHLYSRLPLVNPQLRFLVEEGVPSIHVQVRLRSGRLVQLHCVHPAPPSPTENPSSAERDAELLLVATAQQKPVRSVVVMGDLNDVAWSATTRLFQNLSGLLDIRIGRGSYNTFHAKIPFLRWPLDHVFCSADFTVVSIARLSDIGSDHFPIEAVLQLTPHTANGHDEPQADADERAIARAKIDKVDADEDAMAQLQAVNAARPTKA